jgi:multidrug efflux pump subunit AcrA (membrane-fusion protein)
VLRVIDPARLEILASVPAAQLSLVGPGHAAKIFNPGDASVIDGAVIHVPPLIDPSAATGDVRVSLPKGSNLTAGTPVQVEIMSEERQSVMVIPTSAVLREGEEAYVMLAGNDGKAHRKSIVVGLVAHERTQVASGLAVGDNVILAGPEPVPDGASITIEK